MQSLNDIRPLTPTWPTRPWSRRQPRRNPDEDIPVPEKKRGPEKDRDKPDSDEVHIDEYA